MKIIIDAPENTTIPLELNITENTLPEEFDCMAVGNPGKLKNYTKLKFFFIFKIFFFFFFFLNLTQNQNMYGDIKERILCWIRNLNFKIQLQEMILEIMNVQHIISMVQIQHVCI